MLSERGGRQKDTGRLESARAAAQLESILAYRQTYPSDPHPTGGEGLSRAAGAAEEKGGVSQKVRWHMFTFVVGVACNVWTNDGGINTGRFC